MFRVRSEIMFLQPPAGKEAEPERHLGPQRRADEAKFAAIRHVFEELVLSTRNLFCHTMNALPSPFVFSSSQAWNGNDGSWSTFIFRVGTPEQTFRFLPSTAGQEVFVPLPEGCTSGDPQDCAASRGVYPFRGQQTGFRYNESTTWRQIGVYDLYLERNLGYNGNGLYGFDTIGLMVDGNATFQDLVVAGIATKDFYLGIFGLGPKPSNFSDFDTPQPSLIQTMKDQKRIPSISFGYTAGASYRKLIRRSTRGHLLTSSGIPKALGSLTLGGYDLSKIEKASTNSFPFGTDDDRVLSVGIQTMTVTGSLGGTVTLSSSSNPIYALIDSTVPELWLPRSICDAFEKAFGLTYDSQTDRYVFNDTAKHDQLLQNKPSLAIALGNNNDPSKWVQITLPFAAFDLEASYPIYPNATPYFPIRRAANDSQYALGRAFLQEAYVVADYERSNFSIHQTSFDSQAAKIVAILPPDSSLVDTAPKSKLTLGAGGVAGIVVGATAAAALFGALIYFFCCGRKRRFLELVPGNNEAEEQPVKHYCEEMQSKPLFEMEHNVNSDLVKTGEMHAELHSADICLISDDARHHELPG
jgi:hypothetical protein